VKNLLDDTLIAKIKGIQLRSKHLVNTTFAGEYKSTFRGRGIEFDDVRQYQPGDDVKSINWNVTARAGIPFVKIYKDERELTVIFVVDVSASNKFGSLDKSKKEVAAEMAALLAYLALENNDKVGLIVFSDEIEHYIPPKKGRGHIWQVIRDILTFDPRGVKTNFDVPLQFLSRVIKRRSIAFLISDFQDEINPNLLRAVGKMHELIAIPILDPREIEFPKIGLIELENIETGEPILIDTSAHGLTERLANIGREHLKKLNDLFAKSNIETINLNTGENYIDEVVKFFRRRGKHVVN
jgi:uncharacterized protein (DUF58 family)